MKIVDNIPQLKNLGLREPNRVYWQLNTPQLYEEIIQRHEGHVTHLGPIAVRTGNHTSLSHSNRFIVAEPPTQADISWGELNRAIDPDRFQHLLERVMAYFQGLDVFVQDVFVRVDTVKKMPVRIVTEKAWHNLFARNSYLFAKPDELETFSPDYTVIHAPNFRAVPERDGTNSDNFVIIDLGRRLILIGGTSYAGEIKKGIFSALNYLLPKRNILPVESAANMGTDGDVALFLGVYGTGKTTLATTSSRYLIGDSEHGWSDKGIFSVGRGCYVNIFNASEEDEPEVYAVTRRFGTILENASVNITNRQLDLSDHHFTENVRASYPISHLANATREGTGAHPKHIILLTMDAFGVMPVVSKLTPEQARYHFLCGYTSELVENRDGTIEPRARFTSGYGAPFMPLHPGHYARLFEEQIRRDKAQVWLVNTGWVGGRYGVGQRITLADSRRVISAILSGALDKVETKVDPFFGLQIPTQAVGIPNHLLDPRAAWQKPEEYDAMAQELVKDFDEHIAQYADDVDAMMLSRQPQMG